MSLWLNVDPLADYNPFMNDQAYIDGEHNVGVYNSGNNNPYIYTYNSPIIFIDPNGKQVVTPFIAPPPPLVPEAIPANKNKGIYYRPGIPFPIFDISALVEGFNRQSTKSTAVMLGFTIVAVEGFKEVFNRTKTGLTVFFQINLILKMDIKEEKNMELKFLIKMLKLLQILKMSKVKYYHMGNGVVKKIWTMQVS